MLLPPSLLPSLPPSLPPFLDVPVNVHLAPKSFNISAEVSPVKAPPPWVHTSWAATAMSGRTLDNALWRCTEDGAMTTSVVLASLDSLSMFTKVWGGGEGKGGEGRRG